MFRLGVIVALVFIAAPAWADGPVVPQSACMAKWTAPQSNKDGTNLADLKEYRVYVAPTQAALDAITLPTPSAPPVAVVSAPELDPPAGKTAAWSCKALAPGQWYLTVTAADTAGNEGGRATVFPFVSRDDVPPLEPSGLSVGL